MSQLLYGDFVVVPFRANWKTRPKLTLRGMTDSRQAPVGSEQRATRWSSPRRDLSWLVTGFDGAECAQIEETLRAALVARYAAAPAVLSERCAVSVDGAVLTLDRPFDVVPVAGQSLWWSADRMGPYGLVVVESISGTTLVLSSAPAGLVAGSHVAPLMLGTLDEPTVNEIHGAAKSWELTLKGLSSGEGLYITSEPADYTGEDGDAVALSVAAVGIGELAYQWQISTDGGLTWADISGATADDHSLTLHPETVARYRCLVSCLGGLYRAASRGASVAGYLPTITSQPTVLAGEDGQIGEISIGTAHTTTRTWYKDDEPLGDLTILTIADLTGNISGGGADLSGDATWEEYGVQKTRHYTGIVDVYYTPGSTDSSGNARAYARVQTNFTQSAIESYYECVRLGGVALAGGITQDYSYEITAHIGETVTFDLWTNHGSLGTWTTTIRAIKSTDHLVTAVSGGLAIVLTTDTVGRYHCVCANAFGSVTSADGRAAIYAAPTIEEIAGDYIGIEGVDVTLQVTATGYPDPTFQWYRDGAVVDGDTAATLFLRPVAAGDSGLYTVRATNLLGYADSDGVRIAARPQLRAQRFFGGGHMMLWTDFANDLWVLAPTDPSIWNGVERTFAYQKVQISERVIYASGTWSIYYISWDGHNLYEYSEGAVYLDSNVAEVSSGYSHVLWVKEDGTLWGKGDNSKGQLGDGTTTDRSTPIQIAADVVHAYAGYRTTLFVKTDGTLWGMGLNDHGQLGDGTTTDRSTPVQIAANVASAAVSASPSDYLSVFVKTDGTLWGMGSNWAQQLTHSQASSAYIVSPVQIASGVSLAIISGAFIGYLSPRTVNMVTAKRLSIYDGQAFHEYPWTDIIDIVGSAGGWWASRGIGWVWGVGQDYQTEAHPY